MTRNSVAPVGDKTGWYSLSRENAAGELLKRRQARSHLIDFIRYTLPQFPNPNHQVVLAEHLDRLEQGIIKNLMVIMPPRHLKSETCSIRFPAWYLGKHPQDSIIACSYSDNKAYTFSYAAREVITSPRYQMLWPIQLQTTGAMHWQLAGKTDLRPSYIAAGVGGGITGEGGSVLIIDDPIKNAAEAESQLIRDSQWQWYITTAITRLNPQSRKILIMTRWHQDDLAGRLLRVAKSDPKADQWMVLHFPAIDAEGKALWPEMFPLEYLEKVRAGQISDLDTPGAGSRAFESLYQGNPTLAAGNIFKREWWKFYKARPEFRRTIHSWDTAFKGKTQNDYSVCTVWGISDTGFYLIDRFKEKMEFPELKQSAIGLYNRDRPAAVYIEDEASGQSLIQELKRETSIPIIAVKADKDKISRAYAVTPLIESGRVYLPENAQWLHDYLEELSAFPAGEHDDQVDSTTQALRQMSRPLDYGFSFSSRDKAEE